MVALMLMFAFLTTLGSQVYAAPNVDSTKPDVQLTEAQKQEIATLHKDILNKKKELITKYVKYGVMSEEKGKKIISRLEQRYEHLEQNGFVPKWDKPMHRHCQ